MAGAKTPTIFQLQITLEESSPLIWRRVQVSSQITLPQLHRVLQVVMGWENYHLHEFRSGEQCYGKPDPEDHHFGRDVADERRVKASKLLPVAGSYCQYLYDFGDGWRHHILLEAILPATPRRHYPVCLAGARSGPPEDVGGMEGYRRYLEALSNPNHPDHEEKLGWRGRFDPEYFPITSVNRSLREAFPVRSRPSGGRMPTARKTSPTGRTHTDFNLIVRALMDSGRLPQSERTQVAPDEPIPVPLSARDCELIAEYSFADSDLTNRLKQEGHRGQAQTVYFTLDELEDLVGCIAAEANHAARKTRPEWDVLYDRMVAILDRYCAK